MLMTRSISFASAGLSMNMPNSVLVLAERGSRFIEPMKMIFLSITAVLACRRPSDEPNMPRRLVCWARVGLSS